MEMYRYISAQRGLIKLHSVKAGYEIESDFCLSEDSTQKCSFLVQVHETIDVPDGETVYLLTDNSNNVDLLLETLK